MINLYERVNKVRDTVTQCTRQRKNINLHTSKDEPCQIFINVVSGKSNFEPHMHTSQGLEHLVCLEGEFLVGFYDENTSALQNVTRLVPLSGLPADQLSDFYIQIPLHTVHWLICKSDTGVLLETKNGPFDPTNAKVFPSWSSNFDLAKRSTELEKFYQESRSKSHG